jgi:hypothetical protein
MLYQKSDKIVHDSCKVGIKSSWAISHVSMELVSNVSETVSASIIRDFCDE